MTIFRSRAAAALAAAAALSLTATPAFARGWRHHHDGVDAGDVFAGLLIVGGIAAIAAAASKSNREREDARYRDYPDYRDDGYRDVPPQRYDERGGDDYRDRSSGAWRSGVGVDAAVDACAGEIEQGRTRIDSVETVNREGDGWRVSGRADGRDFSCSVDGSGRVRSVAGL